MSEVVKKGGQRQGSGRKNKGLKNETFSLRLDERELIGDFLNRNLAVRYAIRKTFGLCLHPIISMDDNGKKCDICGQENPDEYTGHFLTVADVDGLNSFEE